MTTPQIENGFTMIANELLEAILGAGLSHREQSVVLAIIRKTYGYGKKEDDMSASQIGAVCGVARQHVTSTLNALAARNVITKQQGKFGMVVGIQKDYRKWLPAAGAKQRAADPGQDAAPPLSQIGTSPKSGQGAHGEGSPESGLVPNQDTSHTGTAPRPESGQVDSPESGHTKENLPKESKPTPKPPAGALAGPEPKSRGVALHTFLEACKANSERPIRDYEPVWRYAEDAGLDPDFVALAWIEFCRRFGRGGVKERGRQKDWRQTFRNYVEGNYLKLWAIDGNGQYFLTTLGKQAEKIYQSREANEQRHQTAAA